MQTLTREAPSHAWTEKYLHKNGNFHEQDRKRETVTRGKVPGRSLYRPHNRRDTPRVLKSIMRGSSSYIHLHTDAAYTQQDRFRYSKYIRGYFSFPFRAELYTGKKIEVTARERPYFPCLHFSMLWLGPVGLTYWQVEVVGSLALQDKPWAHWKEPVHATPPHWAPLAAGTGAASLSMRSAVCSEATTK